MFRTLSFAVAVVLLPVAANPGRAAGKVTLESLLRQMTDLSLLAEYPDPPFVTRQFSSYDRASETPGNDAWFANADRGFMLYDGTVAEKTPYFKTGPQQGRAPDGTFEAGTRVGLSPTHRPIGGYVWVYATRPDGRPTGGKIPQGYVARSAIKMDPQGHVLAEMDGPGCVVRIWSANPKDAGNLRIYLDGADRPVIDAPLSALLGGKWQTRKPGEEKGDWTPFPDPIACERSRGFNLYFPIAYAKHCKITVEKPDIYYHVDYRAYPSGTAVETFGWEGFASLHKEVVATAKNLAGWHKPKGDGQWQSLILTPAIKGVTRDFWIPNAKEGQALVYFECEVDAEKLPEALRGVLLKIWFDDAKEPQVSCPLGDFFGTSPGATAFTSLPLGVASGASKRAGSAPEDDGTETRLGQSATLSARWFMPFAKSARYELQNHGKKTVIVEPHLYLQPYRWTDRSMHFHAKWRTETLKTRPFRDWTYCDLKGKGVFVGDMLSVMNPVGAWWGEGDEKIFVDGEKFPSWFGTGTEDYYGYAWSDPKPFQHAYHNQTRADGPGNYGRVSVNRFHVLDCIPFEKSLRFDMEFWHWTPNIEVNYAATSYWYARPGGADDFRPVDARVLQTIPGPPPPFKIKDALEGEQLKILGKSSNFDAGSQAMMEFPDGKWSGASQLWVRPPKAGEWVDLELPVPADGTYRLVVYLTKARDYGIIEFQVNGRPVGKPFDGFAPDKVLSSGPVELGTVDLKKGTATLRVEVTGTNEKSMGLRYMWGLDCVVLTKK